MRERTLSIPELMLIAGTRVALGARLGLLIANKLTHDEWKSAGWALVAVGPLTTVPLVIAGAKKALLAGQSKADSW